MDSFLEDFLEEVLEDLGDPSTTRKAEAKVYLRRLWPEMTAIYEELLKASAQHSQFGYTETDIELVKDRDDYPLPGGFRIFEGLEKRVDGNRRNITDRLQTKDISSSERGVRIISPDQGMRIWPPITESQAGTWTLRYRSRSIKLHWGMARAVGFFPSGGVNLGRLTLQEDPLPVEQGVKVRRDGYPVGQFVQILSAENKIAVGQVRQVKHYSAAGDHMTFTTAWSPTPIKPVKYQILPFAPEDYRRVFAVSVALAMTSSRTDPDKHRLLVRERKKHLRALRNYYRTTTRDRGHVRRSEGMRTGDPFAG